MATTAPQILDIDEVLSQQNGSFTKLYKVAAPFTTVVNRAQVTDFSKELLPKFGIHRVMTQALQEVQGETGPNGERVSKALNDIHDQVRFVGSWVSTIGSAGQYVNAGQLTDYTEITFYGTGLNILAFADSGSRTIGVSIDGGGVTQVSVTSNNTVINSRNYSSNTIFPLASGLTLGVHTAKLTQTGANLHLFFGYEVINTAWQSPPGVSYLGGKKLSKPTLTTDSYNANFESGALGTKGGHAVVYQKADGSVAKAVNPTDTTAFYLSAATHANESVIRTITSFRELGAGRSDDFSTLGGSTSNVAFTLDDGTTTLVGFQVVASSVNNFDVLVHAAANAYLTITFVGTGLNINTGPNGGTADTYNLTIDGVSQGSFSSGTAGALTSGGSYPIVSGLPYGTHTVKILRATAAGVALCIRGFTIYATTKPTIPSGSVEIADYYLMGNFAVASSSTNTSIANELISAGTLRKNHLREAIYVGAGWTVSSDTTALDLFRVQTTTTGDYVQYTFFGTGFDFRYFLASNSATNATVLVDGSTNLSGFTTQVYGGTSFTASTGVLNQAATTGTGTGGLSVNGLTLGLHTVKITYTSGGSAMRVDAFDIITPVHSPKSNAPGDLQNTQLVGSQAVGDSRKFALQSVKTLGNWIQAFGITAAPTTTAGTFVPAPDLACVIRTTGNPIEIAYNLTSFNSVAGNTNFFQIYVDGVAVGVQQSATAPTASYQMQSSDNIIVPVSAGVHIVQVFWLNGAGTATLSSTRRSMKVREIT